VIARTRAGLVRFRPVGPGGRIALVAPASPFDRREFEAGVSRLRELGFEPVYDEGVFARDGGMVAGTAERRARALREAWANDDVDAVLAVRGGYGSVELLPLLAAQAEAARRARKPFVGYSDLTSLHGWLNLQVGLVSIHGPMIDGRLSNGASHVDIPSFLGSLSAEPLGELAPDGLEVLRPGDVSGPLFGGTLTPLLASFGTPFAFEPPAGHVLFIDEVAERPYRLRRMLTQLRLSGRLAAAAAIVFGQLPGCDEPGGAVTARQVIADLLADFPGPVLYGFPSGHTTAPLVTLPFGVTVRVVARGRPALVVEEAAAAD
jgi:muramoyltetrapeptide carboxypeptidase